MTLTAADLGIGTADSLHPALLGACWPVSSVYLAVVSTNPATLLGFGTWVAFGAGKVPVGYLAADPDFGTVEATGGAKTVTLSSTEMPAHTHVQDAHTHTQNSHNHTQDAHTHNLLPTTATTGSQTCTQALFATDTSATAGTGVASANIATAVATNQAATAVNQNATATNQSTGGGGAHNNLQPFIVVYMWKRTA